MASKVLSLLALCLIHAHLPSRRPGTRVGKSLACSPIMKSVWHQVAAQEMFISRMDGRQRDGETLPEIPGPLAKRTAC